MTARQRDLLGVVVSFICVGYNVQKILENHWTKGNCNFKSDLQLCSQDV